MLRKWLKRERRIRPVKNRTFVSDAKTLDRWCQNDKIELSNQNQSQHCIINAFRLIFFVINKKSWKIESLATFGFVVHQFCWFLVVVHDYLDQKSKDSSWRRENYFVVLHFCHFNNREGKLNRKQFQKTTDFIIYL